nr:hypothetical protein BaRGS_003325 [Batillaria attramentaria]
MRKSAWFETVRVLMCVVLILYFSACVLALYDNCLAKYDPLTFTITRRVEIATAAAGLLGVIGLAVYTVMMKLSNSSFRFTEFSGSYVATSTSVTIAVIVAAAMWLTNTVQPQDGTVLTGGGGHTMVMTYQSTMPSGHQYQQPPPNGANPYPALPASAPPQAYAYPAQPQPTYPGQPVAVQYSYAGSLHS